MIGPGIGCRQIGRPAGRYAAGIDPQNGDVGVSRKPVASDGFMGSVISDDDLDVCSGDITLIGGQKRLDGSWEFPRHVEPDHDDGDLGDHCARAFISAQSPATVSGAVSCPP